MNVRSGLLEAIGNTPLIKLRRASDVTGCNIYGKAEFLNPGGSIKDRAALAIIDDAERRGQLKPGGVIVEGTAGNVGIGIALVANVRGYRSVIVMPDTQSQEKKDMLRLCGADLRLIPAVPSSNPCHYAAYSGHLAEELGAFWAN
jgi:cysteine synthase